MLPAVPVTRNTTQGEASLTTGLLTDSVRSSLSPVEAVPLYEPCVELVSSSFFLLNSKRTPVPSSRIVAWPVAERRSVPPLAAVKYFAVRPKVSGPSKSESLTSGVRTSSVVEPVPGTVMRPV